ncbi:MAG: ribonuclease [Gallionella sp.]|nr:ribonuclease [Gallionella sp.]
MSRALRLSWIALALLLWLPAQLQAAPATNSETQGLPAITLAELPAEARDTLRAIKQGGPFAYPRDGVVFKNYERILPKRPRGYYHEYTVRTPGARNRGARRIISGAANEYYYTGDHYQTFKRIRE